MPSNVELAVGRVDFFNMTCYANKTPSRSELDLLRAYLNKDHNFRHRVFTVARRGLVCDNFGDIYGEAFASSGWRNFASFFGAENVTSVGYGQYFPTLAQNDYLWSYGTGGGSFYTCNGIGSSDDFATTDIRTVFTMFLGSYFGDWDNESNFLRASLGSGYCLTTSWAGRPHWFYHHMGLGETIGTSTIASQNNVYGSVYPSVNQYPGLVHVALLGDPTLRMHPVITPSNLRGSAAGNGMNLSWNASGDSEIQGYHVYRGSGPNSRFTRLTSSPVSSTSYTDSGYSAGATYMVRAIKLERSGSGTYFNASQGVFFPENGASGGGTLPQTPSAPSELAARAVTASQIDLFWRELSNDETGFRIDRKTGSNGIWTQVATVEAGTTNHSFTELAPGTTYYFRIFAVNGAGVSMPSNEASATTALPNPTTPGAAFLGMDSNKGGDWRGVLGNDGFNVITSGSSYPGYATVNAVGKTDYQWSDYTTDSRALDKASGSGRVIGCWSSPTSFTIDVNFLDGMNHKLSLYFVDWDRTGRVQHIEVSDSLSGTTLDERTIDNFGRGLYVSWSLKGQVRIRITNVSGSNALVNGLFFDPTDTASATSTAGGVVGGTFQLMVNGIAGQKFDIFASDNLFTWTKITTVTLPTPVYHFSDSTSQGQSRRFYRAVAAP
ncbi:MAG TPA: fibronectin type III domain-containing protein, partial [Verrucomicrobiae bacterium]|nr:fibronectin type III domain-containing protein [Verrucomicrobiae bacterium]